MNVSVFILVNNSNAELFMYRKDRRLKQYVLERLTFESVKSDMSNLGRPMN